MGLVASAGLRCDDCIKYLVKRVYNIDHNTYFEGAIPAK